MRTLEFVVHCYSLEIPDFARLLTVQLSSLALWPPERCKLRVTVCSTPDDKQTIRVCREFDCLFNQKRLPIDVIMRMYRKGSLFRRGVGRNDAAKLTKADVVWFLDCDYAMGEGCLDALATATEAGLPATLAYPRNVHIQKSHALGDAMIARVVPGELFTPDPSEFKPRRERYAIGGLQIVSGETARRYGYCDGTKWAEPVSEQGGFRDTKEDKVFRRAMEAIDGSAAIDLPNLYRLRHSRSAFESAEKRLAQTGGR